MLSGAARNANFTPTLFVTFRKYKLLGLTSIDISNLGRPTCGYQDLTLQEAKVTGGFVIRKHMGIGGINGRATIPAKGRGLMVSRSVAGPKGCGVAEKFVREFAKLKTNRPVMLTICHRLVPISSSSGEDSDGEGFDWSGNDRLGDSDEGKSGKNRDVQQSHSLSKPGKGH